MRDTHALYLAWASSIFQVFPTDTLYSAIVHTFVQSAHFAIESASVSAGTLKVNEQKCQENFVAIFLSER
jgi:hypothetical protein